MGRSEATEQRTVESHGIATDMLATLYVRQAFSGQSVIRRESPVWV